jgi:hypothetical protein
MPYIVDFENVSTVGLESSPVAEALAGLREADRGLEGRHPKPPRRPWPPSSGCLPARRLIFAAVQRYLG